MRRNNLLHALVATILISPTLPALGQVPQVANWVQIATEGQSIVADQSVTLQACGDPQHCTPIVGVSSWPASLTWATGVTPPAAQYWGPDPLPGTPKVVGAIQTTQPQSLIVNGVPFTVPPIGTNPAATWRFVCPTNCELRSITAATAGSIPTMRLGMTGSPFQNSPNTIGKAGSSVFVQQDGVNAYTFLWSDDGGFTINQTVVGLSGAQVITPVSACIKFVVSPYAAILCGPVATHVTAVTTTTSP
jgi:hypothetical protein